MFDNMSHRERFLCLLCLLQNELTGSVNIELGKLGIRISFPETFFCALDLEFGKHGLEIDAGNSDVVA